MGVLLCARGIIASGNWCAFDFSNICDTTPKEWRKLNPTIQAQFKKKLKERLKNPHVPSAKLSGMSFCYKIKLRQAGYRSVYEVRDSEIVISIIAVGRRENNAVYKSAVDRH